MSKPMRILVVDDDPLMGMTMAEILSEYGYWVTTAPGVEKGIEKLQEGIDCVLSDIIMPGKNGVEFQKEVIERFGNIPFLFMTAYADPTIFAQAKEQGALAFLEKPVKIQNLLDHLVKIQVKPTDLVKLETLSWDPGI